MKMRTLLLLSLLALSPSARAGEFPTAMRMYRVQPQKGQSGPVSWALAPAAANVPVNRGMEAIEIGGPYSSQEAVNADYKKLNLLSLEKLPVPVPVYDSHGQRLGHLQTMVRTGTGAEVQGQFPADQELTNLGFKLGQHEGTPFPARAARLERGTYRTRSVTGEVTVQRGAESLRITPQNVGSFILRPGDRITTAGDSSLVFQGAEGPQRVGPEAEVTIEPGGKFKVARGALEADTDNSSVETPTAEVGALGNP